MVGTRPRQGARDDGQSRGVASRTVKARGDIKELAGLQVSIKDIERPLGRFLGIPGFRKIFPPIFMLHTSARETGCTCPDENVYLRTKDTSEIRSD